jgi:Putative peptidoglycan binding domain/Scaffold domain
VTLSLTALKYARGGRITDPATQLSSYLDRKPQLIDAKDVVEKIAAAGEPDAYLRGLHPKHPQFEKLRQKYLELRAGAAAPGVVRIPDGGRITPGKLDAQVALLRKRLQVRLPAATGKPADETFYDDGLKAAVMAFQKEHGMRPDGIVGNSTRAARDDVDVLKPQKILANMEELRWMPPRVHAAHCQERRRHPYRAGHHGPARQGDAGVLRDDEDHHLQAALERAGVDQGGGAVAEPRTRGHVLQPPGAASVAERPRGRSVKRRLELHRYPHTTSISRRAEATCWAS